MQDVNLQLLFLDTVKKQVPKNISFVDDLAEVLNISRDSAYRRMRGETVLSLDEVKLISDRYHVSLDACLDLGSTNVCFQHWAVDNKTFRFEKWLRSVSSNMDMVAGFDEKELLYSAKDLPIFNYFQDDEMSAFKMYFWMKTVLGDPELQNKKFTPDIIPKELLAIGKKIWSRYEGIPSIELWSDETATVTLKQIAFCNECGFFEDSATAQRLYDTFRNLVQTIRGWAETGTKTSSGAAFKLYRNEILIGDNILLFRTGNRRIVYVAYNTMSVLATSDESFISHIDDYINNLLNRSVLISNTGEKERSRFFNHIDDRVSHFKQKVPS
jgi:hypothetical protein